MLYLPLGKNAGVMGANGFVKSDKNIIKMKDKIGEINIGFYNADAKAMDLSKKQLLVEMPATFAAFSGPGTCMPPHITKIYDKNVETHEENVKKFEAQYAK